MYVYYYTYEGVIDELFGINSTTAYFPADKFSKQDEGNVPAMSTADRKPIILNSGENFIQYS